MIRFSESLECFEDKHINMILLFYTNGLEISGLISLRGVLSKALLKVKLKVSYKNMELSLYMLGNVIIIVVVAIRLYIMDMWRLSILVL